MTPDHISAYGLTLEPGTPLELDVEEGRLTLPPERDQNIMKVALGVTRSLA